MKTLRPQHLAPLLALVLFGAALWVLHRTLGAYHYQDVLQDLRAIPAGRIVLALLLTAASYLVMTAYDQLAIVYLGQPLHRAKVTFASFVSYAFSNNIGLSLLTSGSIRYRLYSAWGLSAEEIARVVVFTTLTFWLGIVAVGALVFVAAPLSLPVLPHLPFATTRPLGLLFAAVIAIYLLLVVCRREPLRLRGWELPRPAPRLALGQLLVGTVDWLLAGSVLYVLLPPGAVSFVGLLGIFLLAQVVALVSHVPGGVGVFESLVLLFLPGVPASAVLGALLVYRAVYYLLPLALAALLLGGNELLAKRAGVARAARLAGRWGTLMVPHLLAAMALVSGAVLLISGATPAVPQRLHWLREFLPLPVVEVSHFMGSLAGAGLLLLARGLQRRLDGAYMLSAAALAAGTLFSLLKGADYEEALLLALTLAALLPCRQHFYRRASLLSEPFSAGWIMAILMILVGSVWLGLFAFKHVGYSSQLWWQFTLRGDAPRFLRAAVGATVLLVLFAVAKLLRPAPARHERPSPAELERAGALVAGAVESSANLALLGDKALLFNAQGTAFVMYAVEGRSWVALGDPVGPKGEQQELAWAFRELCERHGGWPVFYQVRPETLPIYLDLGLTLLRLGEEARVPLADFSLSGSARSGLRYSHRRLEKEGCCFEVVPASGVEPLLPELRLISDAWLGEKSTREKGFSLGYFDPEFLRRNPIAVVRQGERIIAFANLWPGAGKQEISVDMMRFLPGAPSGSMDYLFVSLLLWGKAQGFAWFNLGMAPLAGLENRPFAPLWNRLGALIFRHGEHFYNFQGLREYKAKFAPVWEPRYLACPGGMALPRILTNLATLISGGVKGVLGK